MSGLLQAIVAEADREFTARGVPWSLDYDPGTEKYMLLAGPLDEPTEGQFYTRDAAAHVAPAHHERMARDGVAGIRRRLLARAS